MFKSWMLRMDDVRTRPLRVDVRMVWNLSQVNLKCHSAQLSDFIPRWCGCCGSYQRHLKLCPKPALKSIGHNILVLSKLGRKWLSHIFLWKPKNFKGKTLMTIKTRSEGKNWYEPRLLISLFQSSFYEWWWWWRSLMLTNDVSSRHRSAK